MSWNKERVEQLTQLWIEGLSGSEIGRRLDISKSAVIAKARRLGLPSRERCITNPVPYTDKQKADITEMAEAGLNYRVIARSLNRTPASVNSKMSSMGLKTTGALSWN
jgi:hypothetical protein